MALLADRDACRSWSSLLVTVSQMVDWVHFNTTHDTFHQVVSPKIWEAVSKLSGIYADEETSVDLGTELKQLLMEHSWNGRSFARDVSAVNLLSALKSFKVKSERTLGKGAYAKVLLARSQLTGETVVHKHVQIDSPEHGLPLHVLRELAILQKMRHPHIVRYVVIVMHSFLRRKYALLAMLAVQDVSQLYRSDSQQIWQHPARQLHGIERVYSFCCELLHSFVRWPWMFLRLQCNSRW